MHPNNYSKKHQILARREAVARLALEGLSSRAISERLSQQDPPIQVKHVTVAADLKALREEWRKSASISIDQHRANQLAEIAQAKGQCWVKEDFNALARFIKLEADILGTNAPIKLEPYMAEQAAIGLLEVVKQRSPELHSKLMECLRVDSPEPTDKPAHTA